MFATSIFSHEHLRDLKAAVDVYARRHSVVSENIANIETPGYRSRELRFEEYLTGAERRLRGARTDQAHLPIGGRSIDDAEGQIHDQVSDYDNGVNNVDLDEAMTDLATNDLSYRLATRLLSMRYGMLRNAVRGRPGG